MAGMKKSEMVALLDTVEEKLTDALDPVFSREELVEKVQEVLGLVEPDEDDEGLEEVEAEPE